MAAKQIKQGDEFAVGGNRFRREADATAPLFECERIQVTHLSSTLDARMSPYTFGTEPAWFTERGLVAS